ncbi:MAG: hypothetical protein Faunusvirus6_15 [Faunusvirus sp.]|jgi:hypothetical protein|uniref:Uncharacterized protein n=1 Tax=Faunusvirus sp. TaxID=2487766 RepID=A0A3G4ZWF8_9VIRU|nr:MAG: hypothetical protein Faunusvirus6_15 [Faunusvirus sp.]
MDITIIPRRRTVKIDKRHVSRRQEAKRLRTLVTKNKKRDATRQRRFDRDSKLAVKHEVPQDDDHEDPWWADFYYSSAYRRDYDEYLVRKRAQRLFLKIKRQAPQHAHAYATQNGLMCSSDCLVCDLGQGGFSGSMDVQKNELDYYLNHNPNYFSDVQKDDLDYDSNYESDDEPIHYHQSMDVQDDDSDDEPAQVYARDDDSDDEPAQVYAQDDDSDDDY